MKDLQEVYVKQVLWKNYAWTSKSLCIQINSSFNSVFVHFEVLLYTLYDSIYITF